jgi:hypothetical protein
MATTDGKATTDGRAAAKRKAGSWSDDPGRADKNAAHLAAMEAGGVPGAAPAKPAAKGAVIVLPKLDIRTITIRIVGDAALVSHRWSEKAKKQMIDKQTGVASAGKEFKNPENDYSESLYRHPGGGWGFPAIAFKNSAVAACTSLGKAVATKVGARQAFHVVGELVRIEGEPSMREDMVKLPSNVADIRYRGQFVEWACDLTLRYNARVLSAEQIINLMNTAGFAVGVGEWRPEKNGSFGLFHVEAEPFAD